jgi:hypothetical protein
MKTDRIVSFSAILVGLGSLAIVVYQTQLMRASQTASVLPYLTVAVMANEEGTYLVVRNSGVGPALIEDVRIRYQGREIQADPYDFFVTEHGTDSAGLSVDKLIPGRLVSAGEWVLTLGWEGEGSDAMLDELLRLFAIGEVPQSWYEAVGVQMSPASQAVVQITYASVYGDRWRVQSDTIVPERL